MKGAAQYVPTPSARYLWGGREIKPFRCCIIAAQIVEIAALPHRSTDRWARRAPEAIQSIRMHCGRQAKIDELPHSQC